MRQRIASWIRFFRLPAVLTVPGDLWVGGLIMNRTVSLEEVAAVCLAYVFGMALNDVWDREQDAQTRPDRPIPSGAISVENGVKACLLLACGAVVFLPGIPILILLLTIIAYTGVKQEMKLLGAVLMGACRFQSVWLGMGAELVLTPLAWVVLLGAGFSIFALTRLAQLENSVEHARFRSGLVVLSFGAAAISVIVLGPSSHPLIWGVLLLFDGVLVWNHYRIQQAGRVFPAAVGRYLSLWMPLQAIWLMGFGGALQASWVIGGSILLTLLTRKQTIS